MTDRPNVLFILADQHNAKVLGHAGHPDVKTPNLDRLAAEGVRFDNAVCQNPICTPSRVSYISAQYCHNHGYYGLGGPHPGGLPTVFGHFRRAGYRTFASGKIHCPEYWVEDDCDVFLESCGSSREGMCKEYKEYLAARGADEDHRALTEFGKAGVQSCDGRVSVTPYEDSMEAWSSRMAMEFMADAKERARPFFAHVSMPKPHQCYTPSEPFWSMYDESKLTLPPNTDYDPAECPKSPIMLQMHKLWTEGDWPRFEPKTFEAARLRKLHGYLGCVSHVDHSVGELLQWLDDNGLADDTIVIYAADHGDYACEHDIMEKAPGIGSDAITRVPFIWRYGQNLAAGHVAREIVEAVDVAPTLCKLAGLDPPATADGKDISHLLAGESGEVHSIGVTEFAWSRSVRKGDWRFVYYPPEMFPAEYPEGFGELYNLADDPWEMNNLYFEPAQADRIAEMRKDLLDWLVTTTRPTTVFSPIRADGPQWVTRYNNSVNPDGKVPPSLLRDQWRGYL